MPPLESDKKKMQPIFRPPNMKPILTNRGGSGLRSKIPKGMVPLGLPEVIPTSEIKTAAINKIAQPLRDAGLVVPIQSLNFDPVNARLHPDQNKKAIQDSLRLYGQLKPIVVRKETMVVVAGNGTTEAALELGWTEIAATIVEMTAVEAAGYGLADNRTAELAKWDFEVVARLDRLLIETGHETVGWSDDELLVLRATDWTEVTPGEGSLELQLEDEIEEQPSDAELLMKLGVTIDEPIHKAEYGEVYYVGRHTCVLVIADVIRDVSLWKPLLNDDMLFCPHPGPLLPLTLAGESVPMLMIQPDLYIAGHLLDCFACVHGEGAISRGPSLGVR